MSSLERRQPPAEQRNGSKKKKRVLASFLIADHARAQYESKGPRKTTTRDRPHRCHQKEERTHPAKNAETANVEYKAEFEFEFTAESTLPAAPSPLSALNDPGHMKHTKPSRHTCVTGL